MSKKRIKKQTDNLSKIKRKGTPPGKPRKFKKVRKPKSTDITQKEIKTFKKKLQNGEIERRSVYLQKSKIGSEKIFAEPEDMIRAAEEYFQFVDDTPFSNYEWRNTMKGLVKVALPVRRPYSIAGMMLFFGTSEQYLNVFELERKKEIENEKTPKSVVEKAEYYLKVIQWIRTCVRQQKFDGAAVGHFNANIISRDLGLIDRVENNTNLVLEERKTVADLFPPSLNVPEK